MSADSATAKGGVGAYVHVVFKGVTTGEGLKRYRLVRLNTSLREEQENLSC